jgi:CheY-like chemotaxis protein
VLRLFEPFERLNADRRGIEGTGLGLALTKRLDRADGRDHHRPERGGSRERFFARIQPRTKPDEAWRELPARAEDGASELIGAHTVLYIEDNLSNLQLIEHVMIHRPGVKLLAAMQGSLGLDLAREHRPELILLDLNLPDMPGREVLRRLRGEPATREIPVVVISADATPGEIERYAGGGGRRLHDEAADIQKFLGVVDKHLGDGNHKARCPRPTSIPQKSSSSTTNLRSLR